MGHKEFFIDSLCFWKLNWCSAFYWFNSKLCTHRDLQLWLNSCHVCNYIEFYSPGSSASPSKSATILYAASAGTMASNGSTLSKSSTCEWRHFCLPVLLTLNKLLLLFYCNHCRHVRQALLSSCLGKVQSVTVFSWKWYFCFFLQIWIHSSGHLFLEECFLLNCCRQRKVLLSCHNVGTGIRILETKNGIRKNKSQPRLSKCYDYHCRTIPSFQTGSKEHLEAASTGICILHR